MSSWQRAATVELRRLGIDADALFGHLARATHIKRPAETWRKKLPTLVSGAEPVAVLLRPFMPAGKRRPSSDDAPAVFGAIWAAPEFATPDLLHVVAELVPWCQKELGTSHQAASVGMMVLGVWPTDTRTLLEQFRDTPSMRSLIATTRASLRKQTEAHPK
jgi:hypothetical protein